MQNLFFVSIIVLITTFFNGMQVAPTAPKQNEVKAVAAEAKVAPIDTIPAQPEVKPNDVTDGVWEWKSLVAKYFPQSEVLNALRIMSAENGSGDPTRVSKPNRNGTKDYGLFQVNTCHKNRVDGDLSKLQDAETNVRVASQIYTESGWKPWSTAKRLGL